MGISNPDLGTGAKSFHQPLHLPLAERPFTAFLRIDKKEVHLSCQSPFQALLLEVGHVATEFLCKKGISTKRFLPFLGIMKRNMDPLKGSMSYLKDTHAVLASDQELFLIHS